MQPQLGRGRATPGEIREGGDSGGTSHPWALPLDSRPGKQRCEPVRPPFSADKGCVLGVRGLRVTLVVSVRTLVPPPSLGAARAGGASGWTLKLGPSQFGWGRRAWTRRIPDPGAGPGGGQQLRLSTIRLEAGELNSGSEWGKALDWRG